MRRICIAVAALSLAGCGSTNAALDARIEQLTVMRDRDAGMAEHLDEYQGKLARLDGDLAKLGAWDPDADPTEVLLAASGAAGRCASAGFRKEGATPVVTLTGTGSPEEAVACLDRFASSQPAMVLRSLSIGDHEWTAEIVLRAGTPVADGLAPKPTPPPGALELPATRHRRIVIAKLEQEIAEYERLLGPLRDYGRHAARLQSVLDAVASESDRLRNARAFWNAGWAGAEAPLASGTLAFDGGGHAKLQGPLRTGVGAAKLADVASRRHLEISALDGSSATLTGTFVPKGS